MNKIIYIILNKNKKIRNYYIDKMCFPIRPFQIYI